jgi:copper(I)-binding protein
MRSFLNTCGRSLAIPTAAILLAGGAHAHSHKLKSLEIVHPWCVETADTSKPVAVFMTIRNSAQRPDKLLRATTTVAGRTELRAAGVAPDAEGPAVASIEVGSRGEVNLKRDGPHIRLTGMKKPLGAYDSFFMTLVFERAGKVEVEVMVEDAAILEPAKK